MSFVQRILSFIPRPFKYIQRKLDIESEWVQLKANLKPHKYKITTVLAIAMYPFYNSYLKDGAKIVKNKLSDFVKKETAPTQPAFQWTEQLIKTLLSHIFSDPKIKEESLNFLFSLIKDEKFLNNLIELLISSLKSQAFTNEVKGVTKSVITQNLNDPDVRKSVDDFLKNLAANQQIKGAFIKLVQQVFSSKQSEQTIVNLLKKGISNEEVKGALGQSVNFAVRQVLSDEETLNQLKIFIFFLLRKFENDGQIKGMMDILFAKGLGLVKKKKQPELDKFLRPKKADIL